MSDAISRHEVVVSKHRLRYLTCGGGDPILFIHGMPTYSRLWRNVMPRVADQGQCIALDLIGMGDSDKPDIEYTVFDHIHYLEGFIKALNLKNITLVMHGWGSVLGFHYASRFAKNVRALSFYEAMICPIVDWNKLSLPVQQLVALLKRPDLAYREVVERNYFIKKFMIQATMRRLTPEELAEYERPFQSPSSRKLLWQYVHELPTGNNENTAVMDLIAAYSAWLQKTSLPKQMMYAMPGFFTTMETVSWAKSHFSNLTLSELPDALHFAQETDPEHFASELRQWLIQLKK